MQASNRIIVNTLAQYIRTILNLLLSLYSVRLVMEILGVEDYGIYALVAGVVSLMSFITNSLLSSTQRFLSINQGKGDLGELKKVFSNSLLLHIGCGFILFVVLEILTTFLFDGYLEIPAGRVDAAMLIYQQVVLIVYITFVTAPYRALLVSRENIIYTSIIDVVDGVLKVVLVILLQFMPFDKLESYGWIMLGISCFNIFAFAIYCHKKYEECIFPHLSYFNMDYLKSISKYMGWVTYSSLSIALRNQGLAVLLNGAMGGTKINAAYGVGTQICGMVSFVSTSFTSAVSPQLTASEGGGERDRMWKLAAVGSKISFLLMAMIGIPTMFEMQSLLELWLVEVPQKTMLFGCTFISMAIVDQLTSGLGMANRAIGNIGWYIFITCTPKLLILPFAWYIFYIDGDVSFVCVTMILIELFCAILRIPPLLKERGFKVYDFVYEAFVRTIPPVLVCGLLCWTIHSLVDSPYRLLITYPVSILAFLMLTYVYSLNSAEKDKVCSIMAKGKMLFQCRMKK